MPRDKRLYMTFPIDFPDHPKVRPLSPLAKWTFVEMNAYSRRLGLDGVIPVVTAQAIWARKPLADLVASHPTRPLVVLESDAYVIRDYADHQLTNDDIEDLHEKRSRAGSMGGKAKAERRQTAGKPVASATATGKQAVPESKSESETDDLTDMGTETQSSHVGDATNSGPDLFDDITLQKAQRVGIKDLPTVLTRLRAVIDGPLSPNGGVELAWVIVDKAKHQPVKNVDAYVATACRNTPDDVRHYYDTCDLGVA